MRPPIRRILAWTLPLAVLALGVVGASVLSQSETVPGEKPAPALPLVDTMALRPETVRMDVAAQGTVQPDREVSLSFEVAGRVLFVEPAMQNGAFVEEKTVLARLETTDYDLREREAESEVAEARLQLQLEEAEAEAAIAEWREMQQGSEPPALVARVPQLARAKARVAAAEARAKAAERDVERCTVAAPFSGRIVRREVEAFQFVSAGTPIARLQATDRAEVVLSIPDEDLRFLDLPLDRDLGTSGPTADLRATFGGQTLLWTGRVVRTESGLDSASRQVRLVAIVEDPYGQNPKAPLLPGLYVDATIHGRSRAGVFVVPRRALFEERAVLLVDSEDRLRIREVEILRRGRDEVLITDGLEAGDRLCTTRLDVVVDGRKVRTADLDSDADSGAPR